MLSRRGKDFRRRHFEMFFLLSPRRKFAWNVKSLFSVVGEWSWLNTRNQNNEYLRMKDDKDNIYQCLACWVKISADDILKYPILIFPDSTFWCFIHYLQETSKPIFWQKWEKKNNHLSSAEFAQSILCVKTVPCCVHEFIAAVRE